MLNQLRRGDGGLEHRFHVARSGRHRGRFCYCARHPWAGGIGQLLGGDESHRRLAPQKERALAMGILGSAVNLGVVVSPALIPFIAIYYSWHGRF
ncbi:MAG: hypothetical protein ACR5LD_11775 [Symbiopectobacterium sp.]